MTTYLANGKINALKGNLKFPFNIPPDHDVQDPTLNIPPDHDVQDPTHREFRARALRGEEGSGGVAPHLRCPGGVFVVDNPVEKSGKFFEVAHQGRQGRRNGERRGGTPCVGIYLVGIFEILIYFAPIVWKNSSTILLRVALATTLSSENVFMSWDDVCLICQILC